MNALERRSSRLLKLLSPATWQELQFALRSRLRRLRLRLVIVIRSLRTARGRTLVWMSILSRFYPFIRFLAQAYRRTLIKHVRLVAVVGSFGKTTTTRAVVAALGLHVSGREGWNSRTPLAARILSVRPWARHAVVEVGISRRGHMAAYAQMVRPDIVIVTSIGSEHMTSLGSLEVTREEKAKMVATVAQSGLVVLNGDDPNVIWMKNLARAPVVTYGFSESNTVRATSLVEDELAGLRFTLSLDGKAYPVSTRLLGRHMAYPILAAAAVATAEGQDLVNQVVPRLQELPPTYNRLHPIQLSGGARILLDAYKGALETIEASLHAFDRLPANRKILVIGDVEEPPGSQGPIYKALGRKIASIADYVIFVGGKKSYARLKSGLRSGGFSLDSLAVVRTVPLKIATALRALDLREGDLVLIKGRSTQHLERVALLLIGTPVVCAARSCHRYHDCASCPLLQY